MFILTTTQSSNQSHNEWLASLFSSGLPSPKLPANFPLAICQVLTSPFPMPLSSMLDLSAWSIDLGQVSLELMFLSSLCRVHRLRLTHVLASRAVVQMANPGLDPVQAAEFHVADMLQWSLLLSSADSPRHTLHPASRPINYHIGVVRSPNGVDTSFDRSDPYHVNAVTDQLQTLVEHQLINDQGRSVEVFNSLGNVHPEFLVGSVGVAIVIGSGEPLPESSVQGSDKGESFAFGNDGLD